MITDLQKEWLMALHSGELTKKNDPHKYSVYMKRMRERIDHMFENLKWVAEYCPDILTDCEYEIQTYGTLKHRRLKWLLELVKIIMPEPDVVLVKLKKDVGL